MSLASENLIFLLSSTASVDLNAVATTDLYTVPPGKILQVFFVGLRDLSATAAVTPGQITFGQTAAKTDFLAASVLTNLSAAEKTAIFQPIPHATVVAGIEYTAGEIFVGDVTVAAGGAATCTLDVYGRLKDA